MDNFQTLAFLNNLSNNSSLSSNCNKINKHYYKILGIQVRRNYALQDSTMNTTIVWNLGILGFLNLPGSQFLI